MIGVIAKLTIKPGTNADFEATMKALQAKVHADEPGNKLYALHKTGDVNVYVMLERYAGPGGARCPSGRAALQGTRPQARRLSRRPPRRPGDGRSLKRIIGGECAHGGLFPSPYQARYGSRHACRARAGPGRSARFHPCRVHAGRSGGPARGGGGPVPLPPRHARPHLDRRRRTAELRDAAQSRHGVQPASAGAGGRVPLQPAQQARPLRRPGLHRPERPDLRRLRAEGPPGQHLLRRQLRHLLPRSEGRHLQAGARPHPDRGFAAAHCSASTISSMR